MSPRGVELPDQERCEKILLSVWYRSRHSRGFRRRDEKQIGATIDPETGLERSEHDLLPEGQGIRGPEFVFRAPVQPDRLAEECLLRDEHDGSTPSLGQCQALGIEADVPDLAADPKFPSTKQVRVFRCPTNERGRAEEELRHVQKDHPEWNARIRTLQGREAWTDEEAEAVAELTYRFQRVLLDFAAKGWVRLEAPFEFTPAGPESLPARSDPSRYKRGTDDTGMPYIATVTPEGLEEAERRIGSDPVYSQGAFSSVAAMSGEQRAKVASRNPWASVKFLQEGGK